jgi:hypothetical protein
VPVCKSGRSRELAGILSCAIIYSMESEVRETRRSGSAPSDVAGQSCERCGAPRAVKVGARWLCESCYIEAGSCCPEFGADDLWDLDETKSV